jgi:hypothetical protein
MNRIFISVYPLPELPFRHPDVRQRRLRPGPGNRQPRPDEQVFWTHRNDLARHSGTFSGRAVW